MFEEVLVKVAIVETVTGRYFFTHIGDFVHKGDIFYVQGNVEIIVDVLNNRETFENFVLTRSFDNNYTVINLNEVIEKLKSYLTSSWIE